ncbi:MOSC domain-containing protein [Paracrocinitomix mangrovi]|uniref:MOSC domain-containing protein n=1 Tax=Paracrocinitomix mangrovi TaxID=2862509 RepID=UPI001C8ED1C7|nr:MOSC domain-containing protein [Paracrocinitomix mangrovi]UKN03715.1 MOSC domain-containing protein [Paracrocinitomix mangrovi]
MNKAKVVSVNKSETHNFSKEVCSKITLIKGLGVEGDAHMGSTVKHRSRVKQDPNQPNLRQVHLIHAELFDELKSKGFNISAGDIGENITTHGIDLLNLPKDTLLTIGKSARIQITGLRNPCHQLDLKQNGLMKAVLDTDEKGNLIRKAGIMGIVVEGGEIQAGDEITIELPEKPFVKLERV